MAKIIMGSYMVRYPLGGNLSWALQYLSGFKDLGHDVYLVEKFVHDDSCFDLFNQMMTNDCSSGIKIVSELLSRFGMDNKWCFVSHDDQYYGLSKQEVQALFKEADLYIENGSHEAWNEELSYSQATTAFIDVDPAFTQINWHHRIKNEIPLPDFDFYFTNGLNIGEPGNIIPTCEISWKYIFNPVNTKLFTLSLPDVNAPYSTIMNWKSYAARPKLNGIAYGHKEIEFTKFKNLPSRVSTPMEVALANIPDNKDKELEELGWKVRHAQDVTYTYDIFQKYLKNVKGEFSVVKNMYAATNSGWFSDKSAAFLASGRPVVLQETGFSSHLPVGEGLFAVNDVTEAKEAIELIEKNYHKHSKKAREIAFEYLDTRKVLGQFLNEVNL
ncbi:MAG TPA: hypothetical protein VN763_00345 [Saprospiraceae bacterium]|nr:hypothetical protein [Saprospiraceae bacterium]HZV42978.1 hypothetical protein [Saprospiraceae bacterium]